MISRSIIRPCRLFACFLALALACTASKTLAGENLIDNPGFEFGTDGWGMFVPQESDYKGCEFVISKTAAHSGSACVEMKSTDHARFSIGPKTLKGEILAGDRCRLTFWIRAGTGLLPKGSPSFIVRMFLLDDRGQNLADGQAIFVGLNGKTTVQSPQAGGLDLSGLGGEIPAQWTKVESVFVVPTDLNATRLSQPGFFAQYTQGSIFLDDVVLEKVDNKVPLSSTTTKKP